MFLDEPQESQPIIDVEPESERLQKELAARKIQHFFRSHHLSKGDKVSLVVINQLSDSTRLKGMNRLNIFFKFSAVEQILLLQLL